MEATWPSKYWLTLNIKQRSEMCGARSIAQGRKTAQYAGSLPMLPIDEVMPALLEALAGFDAVVLQAPPGAGKTTRVPLALLAQPWLAGQKVLMLEPRRIAARNAALFMARQRNEPVGQTVGYRTRMESRITATTRVEVVTEGILTRMLQRDPELHGYGAILF